MAYTPVLDRPADGAAGTIVALNRRDDLQNCTSLYGKRLGAVVDPLSMSLLANLEELHSINVEALAESEAVHAASLASVIWGSRACRKLEVISHPCWQLILFEDVNELLRLLLADQVDVALLAAGQLERFSFDHGIDLLTFKVSLAFKVAPSCSSYCEALGFWVGKPGSPHCVGSFLRC